MFVAGRFQTTPKGEAVTTAKDGETATERDVPDAQRIGGADALGNIAGVGISLGMTERQGVKKGVGETPTERQGEKGEGPLHSRPKGGYPRIIQTG